MSAHQRHYCAPCPQIHITLCSHTRTITYSSAQCPRISVVNVHHINVITMHHVHHSPLFELLSMHVCCHANRQHWLGSRRPCVIGALRLTVQLLHERQLTFYGCHSKICLGVSWRNIFTLYKTYYKNMFARKLLVSVYHELHALYRKLRNLFKLMVRMLKI